MYMRLSMNRLKVWFERTSRVKNVCHAWADFGGIGLTWTSL